MPLSSDPLPPSFGRYQLLSKVASGGMAEIWLARSAGVYGFEKRIVIKRILPELRDKPRYRDLFIQEARLCAGMSHPNIVSVFDLGQVQDEPYMAMEHIHGRDLLKVLRLLRAQEQRLPPALAVTIAAYVARALAYAHSRPGPDGRLLPILHRDVSPHNILITFEGEVKLVDFGIAQAGEVAGPGGGKQGYMSPEQMAGTGNAGGVGAGAGTGSAGTGSDVYALGVVLYEMISGKRLFPDREEADPAARLLLPALDVLLPDCPAPLRTLLSQALQPDPAARIDAAQFEAQLRRFLFDAGHHSNSMALAALMQGLFAQELAREPGRAELQKLAQDLDDLHTGLHTRLEPSPLIGERSPRPARGLAGRGERRPVALVAVEFSGATELSLRLDAEELAKRNFRLLRAIRRSVGELGGAIIRYEDGSLLAGFGLERAHADDAERALCWAQALLRLSGRLRKQRQVPGALEVSVGVHVGEVMIGPRRGWRWRVLPSGDTQRLCLLLAGAADPGSVLVSDRVVALVGDRFPFDRGPELRRKGGGAGARRSPTFRLLGGRRTGGGWGGGRWHRRGEELEVLRDSIAALGQPEPLPAGAAPGQPGGRGARILVRGEAGSGKSRLFREIRELALRRNIPVFLGRAIPFGGDRPFAMFRDLISDVLGIRGEMDGPAILERLGRLAEFGLGPAEIGMIRSLYGLHAPQGGQDRGGRAEADRAPSRDTMFAAAALLIRGISADGPAIVLLEDVHCLQGMERALFMQMLQAAESEPLLVLMSSREPMSPGAGRTRELRLPALPPEQVLALAAEILGAEKTGPDLSRLLQRTAEGNPLYVAEILKALHRQGRIWFEGRTARLKDPQIDPGLPDSLNGLIAERVDALDRDDRLILQIAAVIGSRFSSALLLATLKQAGLLPCPDPAEPDPAEPDPADPDPVEPQLDRLLKAGLLQRDPEDERRCGFASVLIWECVNHGIPSGLRRELHGSVARGLEQLHPDGLSAVIESWAIHCHAAGRVRDGAAGLCEAADQLRDGQFLDRALERYQRALAWVSGLDRRERDLRLEARISLGAGEIAHLLGHPGAERFLQVALDIAAEEGPEELEGRVMSAIGKIYLSRSQTKLARGYLESALSISRHCRDTRTQVAVLWELGSADLMEGHTARARATYERGLEVAAAEPRLLAWMLAGMASEALQRDDSGAAWDLLQQVLQRDDRAITGDRLLLGRIYNILGLVLFQQQRYGEALAEFRRSLELRRGMGFRWGEVINLHNIGDTLLSMQDIPGAYAAFEQSLEVARACSWERGIVMNALYLAYLRAHRGEPAMPDLERQIALARRLGDPETAITGQWLAAKLKGSAELQRQAYEEAKQAGFVSLAAQIGRG